MILQMDEDVKKVIEFIELNVPTDKLVPVAKAINDLALPLWGHYQKENIIPISIIHCSILACDQHIQSAANE